MRSLRDGLLHQPEHMVDAVVLRLLVPNAGHNLLVLLLLGRAPIIEPSIGRIPMVQFGLVPDPATRHLKRRVVNGIIIQRPVKFIGLVFERVHVHQQEKIGHCCA